MNEDKGNDPFVARPPRTVISPVLHENGHLGTDAPLRLLTPEQVADLFQCTASWIKERARRREIRFVMIAGQYRFTDAHIAEIVQLYECRPEDRERHQTAPRRRTTGIAPPDAPVVTLQARRPRRTRRPA